MAKIDGALLLAKQKVKKLVGSNVNVDMNIDDRGPSPSGTWVYVMCSLQWTL